MGKVMNYKQLRDSFTKQSYLLKKFPSAKSMQNGLRKFGAFMAGMIMPVIGVIIAWGFFTAIVLGVKTGIAQSQGIDVWTSDHSKIYLWNMDYIISWGISSVIPIMVAFFAGKQIYDLKGGAVGVIATMGVIGGSFSPLFNDIMVQITGDADLATAAPPVMILGAMIAAPLAAILFKKLERLWIDRIPSGFEMLFNNLAVGLFGLVFMFASFWSIALLAAVLQAIFYIIINGLNENKLLWLMPIFIETEKVLFLNNAVNHGILGPLGLSEVAGPNGQSALFYLDPNPGTGMGLLLAYFLFGTKSEKAQSAAAMPVHFIGGIHEVYYPFVLMKPLNLVWCIAGGTFAAVMYQVFDVGGIFTPSPGSIIMNYLSLNPKPMNYAGLTIAIFGSLAVTGALTSSMLIVERLARNERVYFNPVLALQMAKVNRLVNTKDALSINKTKPIASISYTEQPTHKIYEWEIVNYDDGSVDNFINQNKNRKIVNFWYLKLSKEDLKKVKLQLKNKTFKPGEKFTYAADSKVKTYLIREFSDHKLKITKMNKTENVMTKVKYEDKELINKTRTITFKPYKNKKGETKTYKPWVQKVWYQNPEEKLSDFEPKKTSAAKVAKTTNEKDLATLKNAKKILFACEAGMGSSAMGAGIVRKMVKEEGINGVLVMNYAIKDLPPNSEVIICQNIFRDLIKEKFPNAYVYTIEQFLKKSDYEEFINNLKIVKGK